MAKQALEIKANTFQFFTRNPRGGTAKEIDPDDVKRFLELSIKHDISKILAHAPYTLNPCSAKPEVREFTVRTMADDLERLEMTPGNMYNFHPGSHVGQGTETGIRQIAECLNLTVKADCSTTVLLETMAGKGSEIGGRFEELREIIDRTNDNIRDKIGVCLDTCHIHDGGYDIVNDLDGVLSEFDAVIGLDRLKAIHLNDSMNPLASHKDRHQKIGEGFLGISAVARIINHPKLKVLPFYLETPNEIDGYAREIALLKELRTE